MYETTVYFPQLSELAEFTNSAPVLTIMSNHIGGPMQVGPHGNRDDDVLPAKASYSYNVIYNTFN